MAVIYLPAVCQPLQKARSSAGADRGAGAAFTRRDSHNYQLVSAQNNHLSLQSIVVCCDFAWITSGNRPRRDSLPTVSRATHFLSSTSFSSSSFSGSLSSHHIMMPVHCARNINFYSWVLGREWDYGGCEFLWACIVWKADNEYLHLLLL